MVQKVVYNACFGGFSIADKAIVWMRKQDADNWDEVTEEDIEQADNATVSGEYYDGGSGPKKDHHDVLRFPRDNRLLALVVVGETEYEGPVSGQCADLRVAEVPDGVEWTIDEYDGSETVEQQSLTFS